MQIGEDTFWYVDIIQDIFYDTDISERIFYYMDIINGNWYFFFAWFVCLMSHCSPIRVTDIFSLLDLFV